MRIAAGRRRLQPVAHAAATIGRPHGTTTGGNCARDGDTRAGTSGSAVSLARKSLPA